MSLTDRVEIGHRTVFSDRFDPNKNPFNESSDMVDDLVMARLNTINRPYNPNNDILDSIISRLVSEEDSNSNNPDKGTALSIFKNIGGIAVEATKVVIVDKIVEDTGEDASKHWPKASEQVKPIPPAVQTVLLEFVADDTYPASA